MYGKSKYYNNTLAGVAAVLAVFVYMVNTEVIDIPLLRNNQHLSTLWMRATPLCEYLYRVQESVPLFAQFVAVVLIVWGAVVTLQATVKHNLYGETLYHPVIIYMLLFAAFASLDNLLSAPLAALFMALSLRDLYDSYGKVNLSTKLFSGLFYLGMIPLIFSSAMPLLLLVLIALVVFEHRGREFVLALVAIFTPIVLQTYVMWLIGYDLSSQMDSLSAILSYDHGAIHGTAKAIALTLILISLGVYAAFKVDDLSITLMSRKRLKYTAIVAFWSVTMMFIPSFLTAQILALAPALAIVVVASFMTIPQRVVYWIGCAIIILTLSLRFVPFG